MKTNLVLKMPTTVKNNRLNSFRLSVFLILTVNKQKNMATIEKYIELVFPIIEHCAIESGKKGFQKEHLWYLNRQVFYGFGMYFSGHFFSEQAELKFDELYSKYIQECRNMNKEPLEITIQTLTWDTQPLIDKGRKELLFEHMYTGTMFRDDIKKLYESGILSIQEIKKLASSKYKVCLITKSENQKLHKTQRGLDPLEYYAKQKIKILNK